MLDFCQLDNKKKLNLDKKYKFQLVKFSHFVLALMCEQTVSII